ncbi:MAG TPA: TolC family outer membrane protein [Azospirillaceae bacterium]|nr:TolC family outer membrane protein [Azospirillaceae bacterium]
MAGWLNFEGLKPLRAALLVTAAVGGLFSVQPAAGQTLQDALAQAYNNNPELAAERARVRATDEQVPQALSNYRPNAQADASAGVQRLSSESVLGANIAGTLQPRSLGVAITQPIYRGGRTGAQVSRAENTVQAARANLIAVEQDVLLDAATAYLDVVRDQAVLELTINNEQVIRRQLEATQDRFRVGEVTRTDVSQAESRLSGAASNRVQAEGALASTRAAFTRIVGTPPGRLAQPRPNFALPATLEEAVEIARGNNPAVVSAKFVEAAARDAIDQARGEGRPTVNLVARAGRNYDTSFQIDRQDAASVTAQLSIPLYTGGAVSSRIREAEQTSTQRRIQIEQAQNSAVEGAIRAWQGLTTARSSIVSRQAQVRAAEIALEGVRQEATVGARTTLDVLNAEQELLDARVNLVRAQRDELVGAFQVLSAIGQLGARQLNLPVQYYETNENYRSVRDRW